VVPRSIPTTKVPSDPKEAGEPSGYSEIPFAPHFPIERVYDKAPIKIKQNVSVLG
jgi:hypothetical protein